MFVKIYIYHLDSSKENALLEIQKKASSIYRKYLETKSIVLKSKEDETKWIEINFYKDEETYNHAMNLVNEEEEIQQLYKAFNSLIVSQKREITEEDFDLITFETF